MCEPTYTQCFMSISEDLAAPLTPCFTQGCSHLPKVTKTCLEALLWGFFPTNIAIVSPVGHRYGACTVLSLHNSPGQRYR